MKNEPFNTFVDPFYFRVYPNANNQSNEIYCLIHGWSGDENSMSIFHYSVIENYFSIFPRGLFKIDNDKYGWVDINKNPKPDFKDYAEIASKLKKSIFELLRISNISPQSIMINLIGFSQGAAISAVLSILYPEYFNKVALLAGFLPSDPPLVNEKPLSNLSFYIAHGTQDKLVDFQRALELQAYLDDNGAQTRFCQEDLGHKIGANCLHNLKLFFQS